MESDIGKGANSPPNPSARNIAARVKAHRATLTSLTDNMKLSQAPDDPANRQLRGQEAPESHPNLTRSDSHNDDDSSSSDSDADRSSDSSLSSSSLRTLFRRSSVRTRRVTSASLQSSPPLYGRSFSH